MCRWSSQITSAYADCPLNPSRLVFPPPLFQLLPFLIACPYHHPVCSPAHGHTGVFQNNVLWHKLLAFSFAINSSCSSFSSLLLSRMFFAISLAEKMHTLFLPANDPKNLFSLFPLLQFFTFLNGPCQLFISKKLNHPVSPTRFYPWFY